jgi:hypothetical protein
MEQTEAWSVSVEGARHFVRGQTRGIPTRVRLSLHNRPAEKQILVLAEAHYDSPQQAAEAEEFWQKQRKRFAAHPMLAIIGMSRPLTKARFKQEEEQLTAQTTLTIRQMRVILGYVRSWFAPPESPKTTSSESGPLPETKAPVDTKTEGSHQDAKVTAPGP